MPTEHKRMTFAVPPEMEALMNEAKKIFYDKNQSEMIRILIMAGLEAIKEENKGSSDEQSA